MGMSAFDHPAPEPAKMSSVLKQGFLLYSILTEPSGSFIISQTPNAGWSFR